MFYDCRTGSLTNNGDENENTNRVDKQNSTCN